MKRSHALLAASAAFLAACGGSEPTAAPEGAAPAETPTPAAPTPAPPAPRAAPDPMKDVAAWRALSESERATRVSAYVAAVDLSSADEVERARTFVTERGETAALTTLAKAALTAGSPAPWAHAAVGDVDLSAEVASCLAAAELAAEERDAAYVRLQALKRSGPLWLGPEEAARVRALCAEVKENDRLLGTDYGRGVSHWARWQRAIDVMKDSPAVHGVRGPYMVFVSLDPDKAVAVKEANAKLDPKHRRVPDLADMPAEEIEHGKKLVEKNLDLLEKFYEGWMTELGPIFGFTRYTAENSNDKTLMKMNVFTKSSDYERYNDKVAPGLNGSARAYYSTQEPRFITTYDGGADQEDAYTTNQVQCHEATHQIVHFYTWDLSSKALARELPWLDCSPRPAWSEEGFAEFFSSYAIKDGKYVWMQPLEQRLRDLWLLGGIVADKKWRPWELKMFLSIRHSGQMETESATRAGLVNADRELATSVMANLYYAKAWSLMYFLWYAEEGGKPKYRDRFIEFKKLEFHVRYQFDKVERHDVALPVGAIEFRKIMGLEKEDALRAFEKEWQDYEAALVKKSHKPIWDLQRKQARKALGIDK